MRTSKTSVACMAVLLSVILAGLIVVMCGASCAGDDDVSDSDVPSVCDVPDRGMPEASEDEFRCVYENYILPTCTTCGSFDAVVLAADGAELSRQTVVIPVTDHPYCETFHPSTCTENGYYELECPVCGDVFHEDVEKAQGHDYHGGCCSRCGEADPSVNIPDEAIRGENGHCYYLFDAYELDGIEFYEDAERYCASRGGHLAVIDDFEENRLCFITMGLQGYTSAYFGLTDRGEEGVWRTVLDDEPKYCNWHEGEPNDENGCENYAMFYWKWSDATWNDGNFDENTIDGGKAFICEWD